VTIIHVEYGEETTTTVDGVESLSRDGDDVPISLEHGYPSLYGDATIRSVEKE
jgi:hypothetical protein